MKIKKRSTMLKPKSEASDEKTMDVEEASLIPGVAAESQVPDGAPVKIKYGYEHFQGYYGGCEHAKAINYDHVLEIDSDNHLFCAATSHIET